MKTNIEILKEYCSAHTCIGCLFNEHIKCSLTWRVREGLNEIMDMVRRDCEVKSDVLYSPIDFELEEEIGKD